MIIDEIINSENPITLLFTPSIKLRPFNNTRMQKQEKKILNISKFKKKSKNRV